MDSSRRRLLKVGALGALPGLAGCTGSGVSYPDDSGNLDTNREVATTADADYKEKATTTAEEQSPKTTYADLATGTDELVSELEWFATTYDSAVVRFRARAGRAHDTVASLRRQPKLSQTQLDRLVSTIDNFSEFIHETLGPHFETTAGIIQRLDGHVSTITTFADRGDLDRVDQELGSLMVYLDNLTLSATIHDLFTESPAHDRLFDLVVSDAYGPSRPLAFLLGEPDRDYVVTAKIPPSERPDTSWRHDPPPLPLDNDYQKSNFFTELETIFEGVSVEANRDRRAFVTIHPDYDVDVPARLAYVQQFDATADAEAALETLKEETVTQEGERKIGSRTWQQIYYFQELEPLDDDTGFLQYQEDVGMVFDDNGGVIREKDSVSPIVNGGEARPDVEGDVVYAYLLQAGRSLLTIAPSMTAWNERTEKSEDVFTYTWLD